mgnify:CR=1 FL=1
MNFCRRSGTLQIGGVMSTTSVGIGALFLITRIFIYFKTEAVDL